MKHPHTIEERWFLARTYFGLSNAQFREYEMSIDPTKYMFIPLSAWSNDG